MYLFPFKTSHTQVTSPYNYANQGSLKDPGIY